MMYRNLTSTSVSMLHHFNVKPLTQHLCLEELSNYNQTAKCIHFKESTGYYFALNTDKCFCASSRKV